MASLLGFRSRTSTSFFSSLILPFFSWFWVWVMSVAVRTAAVAAVRRYAELLLVVFAASSGVEAARPLATLASALPTAAAAFSIFVRLQVAHFNIFFLLFAHITFLQLFVRFRVVSVSPNSCCPPTTFSPGIRPSKRTSLSFERFCHRAPRSLESAFILFFDELTTNL